MSELMVFLRSSLGETVALSLLHFIWQGAALALVAVAAWKGLEKSSAQSRYTTGCALLLCMLLAPIVTSVFLTWQVPAGSPAALEYIPPPRVSPGDISAQSSNAMWFPAVLALWFAGVTAFSIRAAGGWALAIYRLSISRKEPPPVVRASALELASRLGIIRIVRIYESSVASVPAVFGWLRPVIILPASVVTGLPASHLNAILAHELAHIARHDFLVNCLQSVVEVLLFYHPAVWWLSRKVRQEREICCDATAAEMCGDRILYSRALLSLEEGRQEFALAATGGDLKSRIEHLLQQGARHNRVPELTSFVPALIVFATVLMCAASMIVRAQEKKIETPYEKWAKEDVLYIMQPKIGLHGSDCAPMRSASTSLLNFGSVAILLPKPARMSSRKSTTAVSPTRTHVSGTPGQAGRRHEVACTSGMDRPMRSSLTRVRIAKCGSIGTADSLNLAGKTTG